MVVGDGMMLVPVWLCGLMQLLMAIIVRIITNNGVMAKIVRKYWSRTRNTWRPTQPECQQRPPTVTEGWMCGRAP